MSQSRPVFLVDDPLFDEHRARGYHPERPERLVAARQAVEQARARGVELSALAPRDATVDEAHRVHAARYLEELEQREGLFSALDDDTYVGPRSVAAARRAAGGALAMVDALLDSAGPAAALALLRPPGHHALPDRGMGFCLLNNVALAAAHARARGVGRVAIVDFDVHHGNGTQEAFYADPHVLFVSLHQFPFYPGSGGVSETGAGDGRGFTVNVPLSAGAGDEAYRAAFDRLVLPVVDQFAPELVLVSAGFDAHARDPLAGMAVSAEGFSAMTRGLRLAADRHAGGKLGLVLEGGYDLAGLESSVGAALAAAMGPDDQPTGPEGPPLSSRHGAEIQRAVAAASAQWKV